MAPRRQDLITRGQTVCPNRRLESGDLAELIHHGRLRLLKAMIAECLVPVVKNQREDG